MLCFFTEEYFITIHIYKIWFGNSVENKSISLMFSPYIITLFLNTLIYINCDWKLKYLPLLSLFYKYSCGFAVSSIIIINIKFWMTTPIIPLIPEPVKILTCDFFESNTQVLGFS